MYLKRIKSVCIFTAHNWRGLWVGSIIIAQKLYDDFSKPTSKFVSLLPGITRLQLQSIEMKVFSLLSFDAYIPPALYTQAYYNLRTLFNTAVKELKQRTAQKPLRVKSVLSTLFGSVEPVPAHSAPVKINKSVCLEEATYLTPGALLVLD